MLFIISQHSPTLPVKFFITSRPEQHIRFKFDGTDFPLHSKFFLHDVEASVVNADIDLYMRERFSGFVRERHREIQVPDWPTDTQLTILVQRAAKLFIYAATVCEYVAKGGNAQRRLGAVIKGDFNGKTDTLDNIL